MKYYDIVASKRKIMAKFNAGEVDVVEVLRFIDNARKNACFSMAEDMQGRLDDYITKQEARYKAWQPDNHKDADSKGEQ